MHKISLNGCSGSSLSVGESIFNVDVKASFCVITNIKKGDVDEEVNVDESAKKHSVDFCCFQSKYVIPIHPIFGYWPSDVNIALWSSLKSEGLQFNS